jgi:formylglycine-generating enzyme required for sulfatase activity
MGLRVGQVLSTGDRVVEIRYGGFGEVGVLEDDFGGKKAVKCLKNDLLATADDKVVDAFFNECNIWVRKLKDALPSDHIASAHFALRNLDDLGPVLFMSYVDGPTLRELLGDRQSLCQTVRVGAQIVSALAYAHDRDVRHRDLKPGNILLSMGNDIRLVDWGLSRAQHDATATAGIVDYWSPQRRADPQLDDPRDDIYALGVILHECLTGRYPREGADPARLQSDLVTAQPAAMADLLQLVCAMLAHSPGDRPTSHELKRLLRAADLQADVTAREIERPFCRTCGFVAGTVTDACPVCGADLYERYADPPREGMARVPHGVFIHGLTQNQARQALLAAGLNADPHNLMMLAPPDDPARQVFVPGFDIDVTPVTNLAYAEFVEATNYPAPPDLLAACATRPDHPVVHVTWRDALCYALWAGKRLPRPLEWEKAARGDTDARTYPWGDVWHDDRCNHSGSGYYHTTSPVTAFAREGSDGRSPYGVADMAGNVREWTSHSRDAQAMGRDAETRAVCGGAWSDPVGAYGAISIQIGAVVDYHSEALGFRCATDIAYRERRVGS